MSRIAGPLRILPCALAALALILAAAAWGAHSLSHGLDRVAVAHAAGDRHTPHPDQQDGGHDHGQGLSFQVAALFGGADLTPPALPAAAPPAAEAATLAFRPADPPLPDPPRTA